MKIAVIKDDKIVPSQATQPSLDGHKGAVIKTIGCGLCGSDIVKFAQKLSKNGTVLGHEIVGEIVEINSDTEFKLGDKIVSSHHIPCFDCVYCKNENFSMCEHFKATNIKPGGFSEYIYLSEEHLKNVAFLIPDELDEIETSFMEPLGCCVRSIKRADLRPNSKVLVVGLGSIGILMGQAIKAYGHEVFGSDLIEERLRLAEKLGINNISSHESRATSHTQSLTGFDAIFLTAGADATIDFALKKVRDGGKIIIFASTPKNSGYANNEIYYRELTVMGSYSPAPIDLKDSLEFLKSKKVKVKGLSTIYKLDEVEKAIEDTIQNKILKAYIKL